MTAFCQPADVAYSGSSEQRAPVVLLSAPVNRIHKTCRRRRVSQRVAHLSCGWGFWHQLKKVLGSNLDVGLLELIPWSRFPWKTLWTKCKVNSKISGSKIRESYESFCAKHSFKLKLGMGWWSILSTIYGFHRRLSQVADEKAIFNLTFLLEEKQRCVWCGDNFYSLKSPANCNWS